MRIGSLFSGIGGLELGLEWAGLGHTVWQVEKDKFCRRVLKKNWQEAQVFDDVCSAGGHPPWRHILAPVDLICGGFPCQDVSSAGARKGLAGERSGLWREYARIVDELQPQWVVVENVTSGAALWVNTVLHDLGELGYACLPVPVQADALGAPYPRARIFVVARRVADTDGDLQFAVAQHAEVAEPSTVTRLSTRARKAPNSHSQQRWRLEEPPRDKCVDPLNRWHEPMPNVGGVVPGATEGLARRAAGNCVVPQCAEVIGYLIRELEGW